MNIFPKEFTVGVLNSFLRGVHVCVAGGVRPLPLLQFISLPLCLAVSGPPGVFFHVSSIQFLSFVSRSGWLCPALWMSSFICLPLSSFHVSPTLAGCVRLSGWSPIVFLSRISHSGWLCPAFRMSSCICLPLFSFRLSPSNFSPTQLVLDFDQDETLVHLSAEVPQT